MFFSAIYLEIQSTLDDPNIVLNACKDVNFIKGFYVQSEGLNVIIDNNKSSQLLNTYLSLEIDG